MSIADNFYGMIKNLGTDVRLELISKITDSLKESTTHQQNGDSWKRLYGAFDSQQSADELITELRSERHTKRDIEEL